MPVLTPEDGAQPEVTAAEEDGPTQQKVRTRFLDFAHDDDSTRLDPRAQALALNELRSLSEESDSLVARPLVPRTAAQIPDKTKKSGSGLAAVRAPSGSIPASTRAPSGNNPATARGSASGISAAAPRSSSVSRVPAAGPGAPNMAATMKSSSGLLGAAGVQRVNEPAEEETKGSAVLDGQHLFDGVDPHRKVGGTALVNILPEPSGYSALPRDVSVYIREDSIENLPPAPPPGRKLLKACLIGILISTIGLAFVYALAKPL